MNEVLVCQSDVLRMVYRQPVSRQMKRRRRGIAGIDDGRNGDINLTPALAPPVVEEAGAGRD